MNNTKDIIIAGVSINALKKLKKDIREGASKVISDSIDDALRLSEEMFSVSTPEEVIALAKQALELLETAEVVSNVSGVTFSLPYYEEYGRYESSEVFSQRLEDAEYEDEDSVVNAAFHADSVMADLRDQFGNMESEARGWHSSTC